MRTPDLSHMSCFSHEHCTELESCQFNINKCKIPKHYDYCNSYCETDETNEKIYCRNGKCLKLGEIEPPLCTDSRDCFSIDKYCLGQMCVFKIGSDSICESSDECVNGLTCFKEICIEGCIDSRNCPFMYSCSSDNVCNSYFYFYVSIGICFLVFLILLICVLIFCRKRKKPKKISEVLPAYTTLNDLEYAMHISLMEQNRPPTYDAVMG